MGKQKTGGRITVINRTPGSVEVYNPNENKCVLSPEEAERAQKMAEHGQKVARHLHGASKEISKKKPRCD